MPRRPRGFSRRSLRVSSSRRVSSAVSVGDDFVGRRSRARRQRARRNRSAVRRSGGEEGSSPLGGCRSSTTNSEPAMKVTGRSRTSVPCTRLKHLLLEMSGCWRRRNARRPSQPRWRHEAAHASGDQKKSSDFAHFAMARNGGCQVAGAGRRAWGARASGGESEVQILSPRLIPAPCDGGAKPFWGASTSPASARRPSRQKISQKHFESRHSARGSHCRWARAHRLRERWATSIDASGPCWTSTRSRCRESGPTGSLGECRDLGAAEAVRKSLRYCRAAVRASSTRKRVPMSFISPSAR